MKSVHQNFSSICGVVFEFLASKQAFYIPYVDVFQVHMRAVFLVGIVRCLKYIVVVIIIFFFCYYQERTFITKYCREYHTAAVLTVFMCS